MLPDGGVGREFSGFADNACLQEALANDEALAKLGIVTTIGEVVMKDKACEGAQALSHQVEVQG
jgi:hypothetical protein